MMETLVSLEKYLSLDSGQAKVVVWEHNSHLGDARATEMGGRGEWNVGQLARQRYGRDSALIGFTTYSGTVTAADNWGEPAERKRVRPALPGSVENFFHEIGMDRFYLLMASSGRVKAALSEPLLERAIGVIYRPETERQSHYFRANISEQFDAVIHIDETRAVEPLERTARWDAGDESAETFPTGI
jgi:erythromycin esterase-like protein